jgi:4-hydroxy-2-oxoheptanedioate aldolase
MMEKAARGETLIGFQLRSRSPLIAEMIGICGFDFIYIETEHFVSNDESIENAVRAAQLTGVVPLVRIPTYDEGRILQMLDMGAMGLKLPHVDTPEDAKALMDAGKYPPAGKRGAGFSCRSSGYGIGVTRDEYKKQANKNTLIIPMIESLTGVNNVEAILDTGVDMLRIGRNDLSESMGVEMNSREFLQAVDHVITCAAKRGIAVGASASSVEHVFELRRQGFRMISYMSDLAMLARHMPKDLAQIRSGLKESARKAVDV